MRCLSLQDRLSSEKDLGRAPQELLEAYSLAGSRPPAQPETISALPFASREAQAKPSQTELLSEAGATPR